MNEDELKTAALPEDFEAMLPDGWSDGDDIFDVNNWSGNNGSADGQSNGSELEGDKGDSNSEEATPTTSNAEDEESPSADTETNPETDGQKEEVKASRKLKLKVNHNEEEIDIDAMSDEDLIKLLQKGKAFDQMKDSERKATYRKVYQEQIDSGMTEYVAKIVARDAADGKTFTLTDDEEAPAETVVEAPATDKSAELSAQLNELRLQIAENKKTAAALKRENTILKQNATSAAKAPVRGTSGGGVTAESQLESDFMKGFDSDPW